MQRVSAPAPANVAVPESHRHHTDADYPLVHEDKNTRINSLGIDQRSPRTIDAPDPTLERDPARDPFMSVPTLPQRRRGGRGAGAAAYLCFAPSSERKCH